MHYEIGTQLISLHIARTECIYLIGLVYHFWGWSDSECLRGESVADNVHRKILTQTVKVYNTASASDEIITISAGSGFLHCARISRNWVDSHRGEKYQLYWKKIIPQICVNSDQLKIFGVCWVEKCSKTKRLLLVTAIYFLKPVSDFSLYVYFKNTM